MYTKVFSLLRDEATTLWSDGRGPLLVVIASGWGLLIGTRMIYPILLPYFRETFDLSLTVAGLLVTILWLGGAVGQLPGGILADRYSERASMAASTLLVAVALLAVVTAPSSTVLFLATGLVGVGLSLYPIARITILSKLYPDRIGSALGVTMATGDVGQTLLPPIAGMLALALAWQAGLGFVIPLLVLVGIAIWWTIPDTSDSKSAVDSLSAGGGRYILEQLRRPTMVFMGFILFLFIFIWQSFTGFYPTYLIEEKGLSQSVAGLLFGLFFAIGVVVKPLSGTAFDRIGMRGSLVTILVGPIVGLGLLPFVEGFWSLVAVTALVSTMLGTGAVTQSYLSNAFPADMRGTGLGVIRTIAATLGAAGPVLFGLIADRGYFDEGYVILALIMLAVVFLTLRIPDE